MTTFPLETWDNGWLTVNREFAKSLRTMEFTSFASFMHTAGEVAKDLLRERTTVRLSLPGRDGEPRDFYLKRHLPSPFKEYVKPWLRMSRPLLGARHEWNAILHFHAAGIPTMTPVALGEHRGESFLLTEGIAKCRKLSDWMETRFADGEARSPLSPRDAGNSTSGVVAGRGAGGEGESARIDLAPSPRPSPPQPSRCPIDTHCGGEGEKRNPTASAMHALEQPDDDPELTTIVDGVAELASAMHGSGLHHQDFYLTHLLLPEDGSGRKIHVIDLGRARKRTRLARRWIVKDLAQLIYSARLLPEWARRRFLERYLGRPLQHSDARLQRQIERKSARIARHSQKHSL